MAGIPQPRDLGFRVLESEDVMRTLFQGQMLCSLKLKKSLNPKIEAVLRGFRAWSMYIL